MDRDRLERAGLRWGGLALAAQIWIALHFAEVARRYWLDSEKHFAGLKRFADRVSQLKPAAFKAPWSLLYTCLFVALATAVVLAVWVVGFSQTLAAEEPDESVDE